MAPREIMILLSARAPAPSVHTALEDAGVPFAPIRERDITDTNPGRAAYAMLAIVVEPQNYVAHRTLLGVRDRVGVGICDDIARAVINNHRNYRDLFYEPIPDGLLTGRQLKPVQATAEMCAQLTEWNADETLAHRLDDICANVVEVCGKPEAVDELRAFLADLPQDMTLAETLGFLGADRDDDRRKMLDVYALRTGQDVDVEQLVPDRVRIMTMHSAKGLSATVVFIPALEEAILPGAKRARFPGQVLEAARMLYVSITRARLACVVSFADQRFVNGETTRTTPSRFAADLGIPFEQRTGGYDIDMAAHAVKAAEVL
jgi:superfamily I DNA/RNA helicase